MHELPRGDLLHRDRSNLDRHMCELHSRYLFGDYRRKRCLNVQGLRCGHRIGELGRDGLHLMRYGPLYAIYGADHMRGVRRRNLPIGDGHDELLELPGWLVFVGGIFLVHQHLPAWDLFRRGRVVLRQLRCW